ncbi:AfsR/SARP family transcriptional regulator [Umezawaea tangerina]|uniref:DNA-binding SARP family transcriptional activator n=1 Tax=Umezawaea tangerina TaxID=84725 RepID=A0A2T0SKS9_9PSEU|nr:BTAD domain-containing putative transcriptional regulator [Umezawaea tangerina]PRY34021.1 DNA-binding SARP family transcriptional activator [Umezawaea tangerina]
MGSAGEFRLLGPMEVLRDDRVVPVRAGKHRALLACLLLRANKVVPVADLVEALWGDSPPARTRGTLQTYVMRLRQVLGDPTRIVTTPVGYRLSVPLDRIDVHLFTAGATRARELAEAGDLTGARDAYAETIALWRGPALADVPSESLHRDEAPRLTEVLMLLHEQHVDVELALGNHEQLVSVLRGLTADHPLRERFWAQLMLALYRSSRQAEALEVFRRVGRVLDEQLGIDPGEDLRAVHQAILTGDPQLAAPKAQPVDEQQPGRLPHDLADFIGRQALVARLSGLFAEDEPGTAVPIVTLSGLPGVGKTSLAVHVAHRLRDRFPDGTLYVDLRGYGLGPPTATVDVLARFLRALGVPSEQIPLDVEESSTLFRSLLTGRRMLLVLDNASAPDQVRPLLPGAASCPVLVTSRDDLRGLIAMNGARRMSVDVLEPAESWELLTAMLGGDEDRAAVEELARRCAHLPLALRVAAANVASRPGGTVAGYLAELPTDEPLAAVDLAYSALTEDQQRLFRLLSLVPGTDFTAEAAANVADIEVPRASTLLTQLTEAHLLLRPRAGRYQFHDQLMLFAARRRAAQDGEREQGDARARLLEFYVRSVDQCAMLLYPDLGRLPSEPAPWVRLPRVTSAAQATRWLDGERANLSAAIRSAADEGPVSMAWRLADAMRGYLWIGKHVTEWLATAKYGLHAAQEEGDQAAEAAMVGNLALLHWKLGELGTSEELYGQAMALHRAMGNKIGQAGTLNNLGLVLMESGDLAAARDALHRSLDLMSGPDGVTTARSTILCTLGMLAIDTGHLDEAHHHLSESLKISSAHRLRGSEATCRNFFGVVLRLRGEYEEALEHLSIALEISQEAGFREVTARVLESTAVTKVDQGDPHAALALAGRALEELRESGDQQTTTNVLVVMAESNRRLGRLRTADEQFQQALTKANRIGYQPTAARALTGLATTRRLMGVPAEALDLCMRAVAIAVDIGLPVTEAAARTELAAVHLALGDGGAAAEQSGLAAAIYRETGAKPA